MRRNYRTHLFSHLQGIVSPNDRSFDKAFDAAGKYHIPNNTPYIRYYISFIIQFQFYEKMCIAAGKYDPTDPNSELYKCDFYKSEEAGAQLRKILQKGQSQPWQKTMAEFLDECTEEKCEGEMNPQSLINYFKPIITITQCCRQA